MANVSLVASIADQTASQAAGFSAQLVPTGVILSYGGANAPTGWLLCDGRAISRTTFAGLYAVLTSNGTTFPFGSGDGSTTFNLPDLRGRFPRYDDNMGNHGISGVTASGAASRDTGRLHGSTQVDATKRPTTAFTSGSSSLTGSMSNSSYSNFDWQDYAWEGVGSKTGFAGGRSASGAGGTPMNLGSFGGTHAHGLNTLAANGQSVTGGGDAETRPINVAVNAIIKI